MLEVAEIGPLIPAMRAYARGFVPNADAADELVLTALERLRDDRDATPAGVSAQGALFRLLRGEFYARPDGGVGEASRDGFDRAFFSLPSPHREALVLTGGARLSAEDAAAIMDLDAPAVLQLSEAARARLTPLLRGEGATHTADGAVTP